MNPDGIDRPLIMGILNVTPDSFSNEGEHFDVDIAIQHAYRMIDDGADIIDVGGESTRPGAGRIAADEQINRVIPVIRELHAGIPDTISISIDTTLSEVAAVALQAGASIINDISAGRDDDEMFNLAAAEKTPIILMHMQGTPSTMQDNPRYENVVDEVRTFLLERARVAQEAGVSENNIVIDPGIGFGKSKQDNLDLIANINRLTDTAYTVMLGASRKRFMGSICNVEKYSELVGATCSTTAYGVLAGVKLFRVHDIKENRQAVDVVYALKNRSN